MNGTSMSQGWEMTDAEIHQLGFTPENFVNLLGNEEPRRELDPSLAAATIVLSMRAGSGGGIGAMAMGAQGGTDVQALVMQGALETIITFLKRVVNDLIRNAGGREKLRAACNAGGDALCNFLQNIVCKALPWWLKWACFLVPVACRQLTGWVCSVV